MRLDIIMITLAALFVPDICNAQFYTLERSKEPLLRQKSKVSQSVEALVDTMATETTPIIEGAADMDIGHKTEKMENGKNGEEKTSPKSDVEICSDYDGVLPELTVPNLLREIHRNGIKHPKIVLAQAILETGWFTSSVCRNKNNLFGLTNPRTGNYYEFGHWTDSVRAYYSKVQYRYKGGNYLIWLRDIGYAEDPGYIRAVIKVLRQL